MLTRLRSLWRNLRHRDSVDRDLDGEVGAVYDLLNQDKRNAIELIVEEKAGYRDPEDADGTPKAGKDK